MISAWTVWRNKDSARIFLVALPFESVAILIVLYAMLGMSELTWSYPGAALAAASAILLFFVCLDEIEFVPGRVRWRSSPGRLRWGQYYTVDAHWRWIPDYGIPWVVVPSQGHLKLRTTNWQAGRLCNTLNRLTREFTGPPSGQERT